MGGFGIEIDKKSFADADKAFKKMAGELGREAVSQAVRKVALDASAEVMYMSPVKYGVYRSNWGGMFKGEGVATPVLPPAKRTGSPLPMNQGRRQWGKNKMEVVVSNPTQYGVYLEYGHKSQHKGKVAAALRKAQNGVPFRSVMVGLMDKLGKIWEKA